MTHQTTIPWVRRLGALAMMIALMAVLMTVGVQADGPDWKQAPTGLTVTAGDQAGEIDIAWDPHPQTTKTLSDYRVTWTPDGESFKSNDQTEWYAYPTTNQMTVAGLDEGAAYQVRVRARYDDNRKSGWSDVVTGQAGTAPQAPKEPDGDKGQDEGPPHPTSRPAAPTPPPRWPTPGASDPAAWERTMSSG